MFLKVCKYFLIVSFLYLISCEHVNNIKKPDSGKSFPKIVWKKVYKRGGDQIGKEIIPSLDGNYIILSMSGDMPNTKLIKVNKDGNRILEKEFKTKTAEYPNRIIFTEKGYLILGSIFGRNSLNTVLRFVSDNFYLYKFIIIKKYNFNTASDAITTTDGGTIVLGNIIFDTSNEDIWIFKLDKNEEIIWEKIIGSKQNDRAVSITKSRDGNYLIAGFTNKKIINYDGLILKINEKGKIIWKKNIGGNKQEEILKLIPAWDGGYIGIGHIYTNEKSERNIWILKIDENGNKIWDKIINLYKNNDEIVIDIEQTADKNYILIGNSFSRASDKKEHFGFVFKIDKNGNIIWKKSFYKENQNITFDDILPVEMFQYIILGTIDSGGIFKKDILLLKLEEIF